MVPGLLLMLYTVAGVRPSAKTSASDPPGELIASVVTHVAVARTSSGGWPMQAGLLRPPRFTVLYSDAGSALFSVIREGQA